VTTPIGAMPRGSIALDVLFDSGCRVEVEHVDGRWVAHCQSPYVTASGDSREWAIERILWMIRASRPSLPAFARSGT
jgi:hypothetical protein